MGTYRPLLAYRVFAWCYFAALVALAAGMVADGIADGLPTLAAFSLAVLALAWMVMRSALSSVTFTPDGLVVRNWPKALHLKWSDVTGIRSGMGGRLRITRPSAPAVKVAAFDPWYLFRDDRRFELAATISARGTGSSAGADSHRSN